MTANKQGAGETRTGSARSSCYIQRAECKANIGSDFIQPWKGAGLYGANTSGFVRLFVRCSSPGLRRQLTRAGLALRGMGDPGFQPFQVDQGAGTERRIRAPATHHLFRGSVRVHCPLAWKLDGRIDRVSPTNGAIPPSEMNAALPSTKSPLASARGLNALIHSRSLELFICIHIAVSPTAWLGKQQQ